ncbi:DMT family transporter [Sorangium sp. So ce764]|uniref:DMT family transporter n=1 Tax=unclassified Sorangium TaxID=2621164 RepID=UPI003F5E48F1
MPMSGRSTDWLLAVGGGLLLALMINTNSLLARHTTPLFASWAAHGLGAAAAFILVVLHSRLSRPRGGDEEQQGEAPLWFYLGGIPGALTVVLAAITVNSGLTLSGTIALMLVGQVLFGIVLDHFGLLRTPKRRIVAADFLVALLVLVGSGLIIFGRG